eukprot:5836249-Amphidinium_carterae.1
MTSRSLDVVPDMVTTARHSADTFVVEARRLQLNSKRCLVLSVGSASTVGVRWLHTSRSWDAPTLCVRDLLTVTAPDLPYVPLREETRTDRERLENTPFYRTLRPVSVKRMKYELPGRRHKLPKTHRANGQFLTVGSCPLEPMHNTFRQNRPKHTEALDCISTSSQRPTRMTPKGNLPKTVVAMRMQGHKKVSIAL